MQETISSFFFESKMKRCRRCKCAVFDLDNTLWLPNKNAEYNQRRSSQLRQHLEKLKTECGLFLGVASFNIQANEVINSFFPDLFDVVTCCLPDQHYDKKGLLQKIRKAYAATHPSQKLKWDEMVFFDDMEEVLHRLRQTAPKVKLVQVNDKVGLTSRSLEMLSLEDISEVMKFKAK